jgi:hypothetical protein
MNNSFGVTRREALGLGVAAMIGGFSVPAEAARRPVVVELFTSQGCSSCPPADAFMEELKALPGIIALSINVDYWDYLGWHDTLADKAYSQRQYDYARSRGDMDVYTPQIVVDGITHYVGSNKSTVRAAIKRSQAGTPAHWVPISLSGNDKEVVIEVEGRDKSPEGTIWLMGIAPKVSVKIERGENTGRDITYYNVVRKLVPAGMWKGEALTLRLPKSGLLTRDCKGCVALLQTGDVGPVIGAASWGQVGA